MIAFPPIFSVFTLFAYFVLNHQSWGLSSEYFRFEERRVYGDVSGTIISFIGFIFNRSMGG